MTLKEYIQTLPKDRVQLAATDIDEAAKIEQEHSALDDAVFDNADLKTKSENVATDEAQNPYSFDIADEADAKKFLKGMEVSHPQLANRLRRDVRAWDEMLAVDQKNSARMRRDGGIKFTGDDAEDFDFYRWAYGRGMTQSDTSFSGLLAAAGRGLWSVTKGAGKLAVTATKAAATDNAAAQMELAATAVDSAQSAVSEYQQLGAGIAALTIGDDPQLKMAAMYELAKFSDEERKNHNAWRKAISDSFAEVPVDEDSVNALSETFDISNLIGAGTGKLVTRGIKRVGAGGVAEVLGKSRKMLGSELAAKAMSKVPVLGAPYKRAILSGQVDALSAETQLAFKELAESKSRLASLQGTLAQNPSWSLRDPMVKQIAAQEAMVAEKQGAFDLINGQLNARRGEVTESLNLAGRGLLNRAAVGTLDFAGAAVENTGKTLTRARRGLSELLTGEADDQIVGGVADAATGGFASKGNVITRLGQDARIAAGTMKQNGASIPYFRRLNQDAGATKLTRNAAAFMDKSHIAWALDKSKDLGLAGLAGAPLSGAFGYVASGGDLNAAAESAGGGMAFGIGGGAYGQWEAYKDPNYRYQELLANRRQFRDTLSSRETNGQSQLQIFDQLDAGEQIALASYAQGSPDVNFRLINDPEYASGLYDRENNSIVINRASKTPVEDIFRHEVAHFVERHGLEAQVREMYLGDAEKGVIGQYTEIDRLGNPAFDESTSPEGEKKYTYRLNAEGQKLKAEYENKVRAFDPAFTMSNDYFASELFAEQYADRIFRGGLRRDLGRNAVDSVVDSLANVPLLKQFMGQIGLLFDQNDNVVGTGVFTGLKSNPEVNKLISRFNVDVSKGRAAKMQDAPDQHVLSEKELRDPVVATKWLQSGGSVRFGADGKPVYKKDGTPQFLTEKEAEAVQRDLANALIVEIEKYAAANIDDADMLQRREQTDINGRKSVVYTGRRIPMAVIDAIEAQKKFNPHQLAHLRAMSASVEKHGVGAMIAHFYQAASSKLGGKSYKTVGGRWRRDGIVGFQITKDGNVLTNSVSWEQLAENARKAAKTKLAREVYATSGASIEAAITADVKQYLENLIDGKSGAEGIGEDRKNFINNLLGIRMASNVMLKDNGSGVLESANPLFETTDAPKTILTNLRLDRMNRVSPLDSVEYAWGPQQYRRAKMNLRPDTVEGVMTKTQKSGYRPESKFYSSRIISAVENSSQGKANGSQWKATIKNSKLGVNQDEYALVGVGDLEDGKTYTKADVLDYLRANEVVVKDVKLGEELSGDLKERFDALQTRNKDLTDEIAENRRRREEGLITLEESRKNARRLTTERSGLEDEMNALNKQRSKTHFFSYTLPGAEEGSYREVLLTVPEKIAGEKTQKQVADFSAKMAEKYKTDDWWFQATEAEQAEHNSLFVDERFTTGKGGWRDGHSQYADIPNPIVRLRTNERTTADGKRMLFIEEIQAPQKEQFEKMPALFQKNWREIAFKWALRTAADNGFDSVGYTTGEQQAARYDLSKQVDTIQVERQGPDVFSIAVRKPGNRGFIGQANGVKASELESHIGKDLAAKATKEVGGKVGDNVIYNGLDLKIGGEGLKKLYDQDFRNVVNNLPVVKKSGQKVGIAEIVTQDEKMVESPINVGEPTFEQSKLTTRVYSINVAPEMRNTSVQFRPETNQPQSQISGYTPTAKIENAPIISLSTLRGKKIFPIIADLTAVGQYKGINSVVVVPVNVYGGPEFPLMETSIESGLVWANEGKGISTRKTRLMNESDGYAVVTAMSQNAHASNTSTVRAYINTLEAYVKDGRVSDKGIAEADAAIANLTSEVKQKIVDSEGAYVRDKKGKIKTKTVDQPIDLPSVSDPSFGDAVRNLTFDARQAVVSQLARAKFEEYGFPPAKRVLDEVRDQNFNGVDIGDSLLVIKLDRTNTLVKLGENGVPAHPDYSYGVRGQIVGRFKRPIPAKLLFSEFYDARRKASKSESSDPRSFSLKMPVTEITDAKIEAAKRLEETVAQNPQQMRAALSAATDSWSTSDTKVNEGGVGVADFVRAIRENKSSASLTPYSESTVKEKIKKGDMRVFKLNGAEIYFALLKDGEKSVISSVVNNEPGARGIAMPAVMSKAIQEGATHLDCFAVKSARYPNGKLPEAYSLYGFEEDTANAVGSRVDFSKEFFDADVKSAGENPDFKFADLLHSWQSEGWNPSTPKPQVVFMRLNENFTSNDSRKNYTRRLLETSFGDLAGDRRPAGRSVRPDRKPDSTSAGDGRSGSDNSRADRRVEGADRGAPNADERPLSGAEKSLDDYRAIVRNLASLTDEDAKFRGLDLKQLKALQELLSKDK